VSFSGAPQPHVGRVGTLCPGVRAGPDRSCANGLCINLVLSIARGCSALLVFSSRVQLNVPVTRAVHVVAGSSCKVVVSRRAPALTFRSVPASRPQGPAFDSAEQTVLLPKPVLFTHYFSVLMRPTRADTHQASLQHGAAMLLVRSLCGSVNDRREGVLGLRLDVLLRTQQHASAPAPWPCTKCIRTS